MFKKLSLAFLIVFLFSATAFSNQPAYKLNEQYTAVRNDVFTKLIENDKLLDVYKEEVSYLKTSLEELRGLQSERYTIQSERIDVLKETVLVKDDIIALKDKNVENYKALYDIKSAEVRKVKRDSLLDKLLVLGLGAAAASNVDDNGAKAAIGIATLTFVLK